jgi:hypothetical protein
VRPSAAKANRGDRYTVSDLCAAWERGELKWLWSRTKRSHQLTRPENDPKRSLHAASVHVRQGRLGKACTLLSSSGIAPHTDTTRSKLEEKHPQVDPPEQLDAPDTPPIQLSAGFNLLKVLRSFAKDVGTDGTNFRIQHLLDANEAQLPSPLMPRLKAVVNLLLSGKATTEVQLFLAGARLTALAKLGGDVRPIAAGNIFRRIASKCVCVVLQTRFRVFFGDLQLGVACRGGAEQMVHMMRDTVERHWDDRDFTIFILTRCGGRCCRLLLASRHRQV